MRAVAVALLGLAAVLAAGCGEAGIVKNGDASAGKTLFVKKCGSCHTLADAGTQGTIGPNLDDAFAGARAQHFKQSTIRQVVRDQIQFAASPMPENLVKGGDADSVATYVASVAGVGSAASPPAAPPPPAAPGAAPSSTGKALFTSLACAQCHSLDGSTGAGPTFKGLYGSTVKLVGGQSVTANDAYLIESILEPDKQTVAGFQKGVMSAVIKPHSIPLDKVRALVAFIKAQK